MELDDYISLHIDKEPDNLRFLNRRVNSSLLYPRMCSGHIQGRLLKMLTRMINPLHVLELGTYAGYSALCIAEGLLKKEATVDTIEIDDEMEDFILNQFAASPFGTKIKLHIGDALKVIPVLSTDWDMVYIDANKRNYTDYYNLLADNLKSGAYIIADNTLWDGKVLDTTINNDAQTKGISEFNDMVANDNRMEKIIIPIRDGLTIIRKK